jgi:hypothetical protein
MITLDDLRERAVALAEHPDGAVPVFDVPDDDAAPAALVAIVGWLGADDARAAVRLVAAGEPAGYLPRAAIYDLLPALERGIGSSDPQALPGTSGGYHMIELECPVAGCPDNPRFVIAFDEDDPPACDAHPDEDLQLKSP